MPPEQAELLNIWGLFQNQWNWAVKVRWGQLADVINAANLLGT